MDSYNSNPLIQMLVLSVVFIVVCFVTMRFRQYFGRISTLPYVPIVIKCALFWGGALAIICLGCVFWLSNHSIKGLEYFILVPIASFIGAIYGLVYKRLIRKKNLSTSLTNRALVGLGVGLVLGILFSVLCAINLEFSYNPSPGYGAIADFGFLYFFPMCIFVSTVFLGLFTPRNLLLGKVKSSCAS